MSPELDIGNALEYGFDRLRMRGGAMLLAAYVLLQLATQVGYQSVLSKLLGGTLPSEQLQDVYPLAIDVQIAVGALLSAGLLLTGFVFTVVAIRALYADLNDVPSAEHTRRLARTVVATIAVSVIGFVAVAIGFIFFIIPGVYLAVSLVFAQPVVILEDASVIEALQRSWTLTAGNRIRLFALGLLFVVAGGIVGGVGTVLGTASPFVGALFSNVVNSVVSLYGLGVLVGAYRQVTGQGQSPDSPVSTAGAEELDL